MLRENTRLFADESIPLAEEGQDRAVVADAAAADDDDDDGSATAVTGVSTVDARNALTQQAINEGVVSSSRPPAAPQLAVGVWGGEIEDEDVR